ncbi:glycosyltransferase family 4 protein [Marinicrinis lubricantis]|uniref:Glycosyltransferase family 4 protein n=1 Tax=Marinicrinis lubricantis TaxID=2086470 RepID=A0ABW1IKE2_9BACL
MRIIMLTADFLPNIGGIASHVYHLSTELTNRGHEVIVINALSGRKNRLESYQLEGVHVIKAEFIGHSIGKIEWLKRTAYVNSIVKMVNKQFGPVDLIHQHDHLDSTLSAKRFHKICKWVWTNHTSGYIEQYESPMKRRLLKWLYHGVHAVIGVSEERTQKARMLINDEQFLRYIPNGVNTRRFRPDIPKDCNRFGLEEGKFTILCPSRMTEVKGNIYFAEAIKKILQDRTTEDLQFVFLGSEEAPNTNIEYINAVKRVITDSGITSYVKYLGNIPMEEMEKVYAVADIVVLPSLQEAVSLAALEAMAMKKAVVASNVGGFPEIITSGQTGLLVPPKSSDELAKAIVKLYQNQEMLEQITNTAFEKVKDYSWSIIAEKTESLYKGLINYSIRGEI